MLGARRKAQLDRVADQINQNNGNALALVGDACDADYAQALVDLASSGFGGLDGAFNNAGIMGDMSSVPDMTLATWQQVISTNLTAAFLAARA